MKMKESYRQEYSRAMDFMDVMHRFRRVWGGFQPPPPLKRSDMMLMGAVHQLECDGGVATVSSLAKTMHQTRAGISQKVSALEELGYLERVVSTKDRRTARIVVTEKGGKVGEESFGQLLRGVDSALEKLGGENCQTLHSLLEKLCDAAEEVQQTGPPAPREAPDAG